jgi:hypothetical protein
MTMPFVGVCLHCALREFVESLERGEDPVEQPATERGMFTNGVEAHMLAEHSDPKKLITERADLDRRAQVEFSKLMDRKRRMAANARNN